MPSPRTNAEQGDELSTALAKLERHSAIDDELLQWERHKLCLLTKRTLAAGQKEDWLNDTHRHTIVPYSKAWNLDFAQKMQKRLPPEIRSMVFDHLWDFNYKPMYIRALGASHVETTHDINVNVRYPKGCSQNVKRQVSFSSRSSGVSAAMTR
ncbi:hypothetical protein NX059_005585 [Plenodomus lindquistii]|nr:hypothetical protein NX059_005585 [Plenodomus lindquistii]